MGLFSAISKVVRASSKGTFRAPSVRPTARPTSTKPNQTVKVIGEKRDKKGKSTKIITIKHPKKTTVQDTAISKPQIIFSPRSKQLSNFKSTNKSTKTSSSKTLKITPAKTSPKTITVGTNKITAPVTSVRPTTAQGINIAKLQPRQLQSPINQETGLGITFKTNRPVQRIEGTGKKLFGDFGIPIRPDNAILIRPKDPSQTKDLVNQFRKKQNTHEIRQLVQGTAVQAVRISEVKNLKFGGSRLKDIATVTNANNKVLQKGDIVFRRVGQDPKDEFTFGAIGDTFYIDKTIKNPKPFSADVEPRPELLSKISKTGINKDDPMGELLKIKQEQVGLQGRLSELVSSEQFSALIKENPKVGKLIKASELGVQDTSARGGSIIGKETKAEKLARLQRELDERFAQTTHTSVLAGGFDELIPTKKVTDKVKPKIGKGSELGVQDTSARGANIVKDKLSLGSGQGDLLIKEEADIGLNPTRTLFDDDLTDVGRFRLLRRVGADDDTAKVFAKQDFESIIDDVENPKQLFIDTAENINKITPPKSSLLGEARQDRTVFKSFNQEGGIKLSRQKPTARQTRKIAKELNNPVIFENSINLIADKSTITNSPLGRRAPSIEDAFQPDSTGLPRVIRENKFASGFDEFFGESRRKKFRKRFEDIPDVEDLF